MPEISLKKINNMQSGTGLYLQFDRYTDEDEALEQIGELIKTHFDANNLRTYYPDFSISDLEVLVSEERKDIMEHNPNRMAYKLLGTVNTGTEVGKRQMILGFINFRPMESRDAGFKTYMFTFGMRDPSNPKGEFNRRSDLVKTVVKNFSNYVSQSIHF